MGEQELWRGALGFLQEQSRLSPLILTLQKLGLAKLYCILYLSTIVIWEKKKSSQMSEFILRQYIVYNVVKPRNTILTMRLDLFLCIFSVLSLSLLTEQTKNPRIVTVWVTQAS